MIENFEELTYELTKFEIKKIIPYLVNRLKNNIGKESAVKNQRIIDVLHEATLDFKTTPPRVRKYIHHIRVNDLVMCLMATSKGYYRADSYKEELKYIKSLYQRRNAIDSVIVAHERQFKKSYPQVELNF